MSRFGKSWKGADLIAPGVYTYTDTSKMVAPRGTPSRALVIIATGRGGGVGSVTHLTSSKQVTAALVSGDLAHMTRIALGAGATDVYSIRVNQATAATLDLGDLVLSARNFGLIGRALQAQRTVSALRADADDLVLRHGTTGQQETYTALGPVIDVTFRGAGSNATIAVTRDGSSGVVTVALTSDAAAEAATFTSDAAPTVRQLVTAINNTGAWSAREVGDPSAPITDLKVATSQLDSEAKRGTLTTGVNAIIRALEGSALATGAGGGAARVTAADFRFFSGGSEGPAVTVNDWVNALALAETLDVVGVVVGSGDLAVAAAARSHVAEMSTIKARRERRLWIGPALTNTKAALKVAASAMVQAIGDELVSVAGNTVKDFDLVTNRLTEYPAYYFAAYAAGIKASRRPEEGLTNVKVNLPGLGYAYNLEDIEELLEAGVMPGHFDTELGYNVITQGVTAYTRDANVILRKASGMDIMHYVQKKIRIRLKRFVGQPGDQSTVRAIKAETEAALREEIRSASNPFGVLTPGVDDDGNPVPAYRNLEAQFDGFDFTAVDVEMSPVGTNEYIGFAASFSPVRIVG
ncbi:phage tail sheath subtilisin-like domain-containing protein [Deinococcus sp. PEB2-67]